jgi:aminoglycoside/choline kinase family phosphotransferase
MTSPAASGLWPDVARAQQFQHWLAPLIATHALLPDTLVAASSDASTRRYLRLSTQAGDSLIVMDAPANPNQVAPFMDVASRMVAAGLHVPRLLAADTQAGFVLMEDLGPLSYLQALQQAQHEGDAAAANRLMRQASQALLAWQRHGDATGLPEFDATFIARELQIFVDWCVQAQFGRQWSPQQQAWWDRSVAVLSREILAQPRVPMHRDFMPRNLMVGANDRPGVLDFQDAVLGPVSYDIGSLLRDAFISWDEAEELDWAIRYWEDARRAGLFGQGEEMLEMGQDFGLFWRALEWTVLQRHLKILGIFCRLKLRDGKPGYAEDLPRFFAYAIKTASRYVELAPLLRLLEDLQPQLLQTGFSLR